MRVRTRWRVVWGVGLGAAVLAVLLGVRGVPAEESVGSVLEGVAGLEKPVSLSEAKISLGEVISRITRDTGVALSASKEVADEPVSVAVEDYTARRLLEGLSELLDYQWRVVGTGSVRRYELGQDLAAKNREEALRRAFGGDLERRFQEAFAEVIAMAELPQGEIDTLIARHDEHQRRLLEMPEAQRIATVNTPEVRAMIERGARADQLWSPVNRSLAKLIGGLKPEEMAKLREGELVTFSSRPGPGEFTLPVELMRTLRESTFQLSRKPARYREGVSDSVVRRNERSEELWTRADDFQVIAWLDAEAPTEALRLYVNAYPLKGDSPAQDYWGGQMGRLRVEVASYATKLQLNADERTEARAELLRRDPVLGASRSIEVPPSRPTQRRLIFDYLPTVSRAYRVPMISDAYQGSMQPRTPSAKEMLPLFERMDRLTGIHHHWEMKDGLIRVRNRTWFLNRGREVPLRIVRAWQETCKQYGALRWEEFRDPWARRAGAGEDEDKSEMGLPSDFGGIRARFSVPLFEALTQEQRRLLERGHPLRMSQMSRAQQALFLGPLRQGNQYSISEGLPPRPKPNPALATFSARTEQALRTRDIRDGVTRYRDQPLPAGGRPSAPAEEDMSARRYVVTKYLFDFRYGAESPRTESLTVATPAKRSSGKA